MKEEKIYGQREKVRVRLRRKSRKINPPNELLLVNPGGSGAGLSFPRLGWSRKCWAGADLVATFLPRLTAESSRDRGWSPGAWTTEGSGDHVTPLLVTVVIRADGFSLRREVSWPSAKTGFHLYEDAQITVINVLLLQWSRGLIHTRGGILVRKKKNPFKGFHSRAEREDGVSEWLR